ncbi:FAD-dependent monooxygenase [Nocardioides sp. L-11A]|uniref:FAD binding domain-containing protein n=1 Tax=Nocardioides sp. L-11A TaxID=3043848 RepID=UPI002499EE16|nr:2,6-dihydroxypyridine 3-hydroxylase [Nocardioides sp. L-11A]
MLRYVIEKSHRDPGAGRRAVVVGGSLAGLHAAALLRSDGWDVHVYERSAELLDGAGAGIIAHPATLRFLTDVEGVPASSICCRATAIRTYGPDGASVAEPSRGYLTTSWTALYRSLLASVGHDRYHLGHELVGFDPGPDSVSVSFASGHTTRADLVVAADGIASAARRLLKAETTREYSGYVGWRGIVDPSLLDPRVASRLSQAISFGSSSDGHIVAYPIPKSGDARQVMLNFVWYRNVEVGSELDELMTDAGGVRRDVSLRDPQPSALAEMRASAVELGPDLANLVASTPKPFLQTVFDQFTDHMAFGRIALIGDAASVARPHAAAGTAKAAENGRMLAVALRESDDNVPAALSRWEPDQLELGQQLIKRSKALGESAQAARTWPTRDPASEFGLYGPGR